MPTATKTKTKRKPLKSKVGETPSALLTEDVMRDIQVGSSHEFKLGIRYRKGSRKMLLEIDRAKTALRKEDSESTYTVVEVRTRSQRIKGKTLTKVVDAQRVVAYKVTRVKVEKKW